MGSNAMIITPSTLDAILFELLVILLLRVPVNESPVFLLYHDWALGLMFLDKTGNAKSNGTIGRSIYYN
jgi:hypothetical protein